MALDNASLTVALAMLTGVVAQTIAHHMRIPGIVLLLVAGVLVGPDVAALVRPVTMNEALQVLVGFAVAIILFEGGLHLNLKLLRAQAKPIRRLVTVGALVTGVGGTLGARLFMRWDWRLCALFGTLVIVTGPTVITPLLRRIKVRRNLATILEAEAVFIDAVGATIAMVALEVVLAPSHAHIGAGFINVLWRIGLGSAVGLGGGLVLGLLLRLRAAIPDRLENIFALAFAVAIFQVSNALASDSGIAAAIVAGIVVGNTRSQALAELLDFKEQLTVFFIGTLFVLLAADVRLADLHALGLPGLLTVAFLMVVVRPANVFLSTAGTGVDGREKLFLSWLAPRGIVAAAIASLFAHELAAAGIAGGRELQALVFLVIAVTVAVQGLGGGVVASLLRVRRGRNLGYLILGANAVARALGEALRGWGEQVIFVDSNADACRAAEAQGFPVLFGNGLEERTLVRGQIESRSGCIGLTPNEDVNFLFARKVRDSFRGLQRYVALESEGVGVTPAMVRDQRARVLFGSAQRVSEWEARLSRGRAHVERWRLAEPAKDGPGLADAPKGAMLPLVGARGGRAFLVSDDTKLKKGDVIAFAVPRDQEEAAGAWLTSAGWEPVREAVESTAAPRASEKPAAAGQTPGSAAMPPRSAGAPPEFAAMPPQFTAMPPQFTAMPPQSAATPPESAAMPPESAATPPESGATPPESAATPPDSRPELPDSAAQASADPAAQAPREPLVEVAADAVPESEQN